MDRRWREVELYRAAARVFRRKGLQQARLQDVADELGVPRGALYYYVTGKAELFRAVIEMPLCRLLARARETVSSKDSPEVKLAHLVTEHLNSLATYRESWLLLLCEGLEALPPMLSTNLQELLRQYEACWKAVVAEGMELGIFATTSEPDALVRTCIGLVQGIYCWQHLIGEEAPAAVAAWLTPLMLQSLQGTIRGASAAINP